MSAIKPVSVQIRAVDQFTAPLRRMVGGIQSATAPLTRMQGQFNAISKRMSGMRTGFEKVGSTMQGIGSKMSAGMTLPILGGGALAVKAFNEVDAAMDSLVINTGASGEELKGLESSFRNLSKTAPSSLADIATTLSGVHTRMALVGKPLEDFSNKVLKVSRMTGSDVSTSLQMITKAMNDAGATGPESAKMLDMMFLTSQKTGVSIETLGEQMFKFGAPLRALGIDATKSAALLGSFEKAGVNTDLVMGALRKSLGKMAKAGVAPEKGLEQVISRIKEAKTAGEATSIAFDVFGAKAGADMALAIREGRFEIGALMGDLENSAGSIDKAAAATDGFEEKLKLAKNQMTLQAATIGEKLTPMILTLVEKLTSLMNWYNNLTDGSKNFILITAGITAVLGPLILAFGFLATSISAVMTIWPALVVGFGLITAPILLITALILGAIAMVWLWVENWDEIVLVFKGIWITLQEIFQSGADWLESIMVDVLGIPELIQSKWQGLVDFFGGLSAKLNGPVDAIRGVFEGIFGSGEKSTQGANQKANMNPQQISQVKAMGSQAGLSGVGNIMVDFQNTPKGTKISNSSNNMNLSVNQGYNMLGAM